MKYIILLALTNLFSVFLFGQVNSTSPITIGQSIIFHSKVLDENRTVLIHNPNDYITTNQRKKYPVVYVLDGHDHFRYLVGLLHRMGGHFLPKMIVVGITQNDRPKDLGPKGFDKFSAYIETELIPFIDSSFSTSKSNTLIGHSLGGGFTVATLLKSGNLFKNYIAIDPYIVQQSLPDKFAKLNKSDSLKNKSLYISIARTFPDNLTFKEAQKDTSETTEMVREINKLTDTIKKKPLGLKFSSDYFDTEKHMSVPNISIYKGLRFIFKEYIKDN